MKKIFTLVFTLVFVLLVNAQVTPASTVTTTAGTVTTIHQDKPATITPVDILTMLETEYNFEKIPQGKPVTHVFDVFNNSSDTLRISNVQASCGCTTPMWNKDEPVAPGKQTKITVGYNAAAEGPFTKQITITYNAAQVKVITIKGEVWKTPAASAPENKNLSDLKN